MGWVRFELADGTTFIVRGEDDARRLYEELWALADLPGAVSTAAALLHQSRRRGAYRQPVVLTADQSAALRQALDALADT